MKKFMAVLAMAAIVAFAAPALAATNPFMDVPQGHWSYDAVGLLASRGIVSGYPDGAFKGAQPATRYEMASVVARALVTVDAEKASAQDMELLKRLVMEFKDELDALGVKVDELDKRVAAIEDNLGGWKFSGNFMFDANFAGGDQGSATKYTETSGENSFQKAKFYLVLQKQIDEKTSFYAQIRSGSEDANGGSGVGDINYFNLRNIHIDTVLPWDVKFRVGRFFLDFETENGLRVDNDPLFANFRVDGFRFAKAWNNFSAKAVVGRNAAIQQSFDSDFDHMTYALDLTWQLNEAFFFGVNGVWLNGDNDGDTNLNTYSAYLSYNFTPAIKLQGVYYYQDMNEDAVGSLGVSDDNPKAWKVVLDLDQDLLKFTGLRFEYAERDNSFVGPANPYSYDAYTGNAASVTDNTPFGYDSTTKLFFAIANQKWNDKWSSFLRYTFADFDTEGYDDAHNYGIGVTYQYTPAIAFRLAYDIVDYGNGAFQTYQDKDHVIQFRTAINF